MNEKAKIYNKVDYLVNLASTNPQKWHEMFGDLTVAQVIHGKGLAEVGAYYGVDTSMSTVDTVQPQKMGADIKTVGNKKIVRFVLNKASGVKISGLQNTETGKSRIDGGKAKAHSKVVKVRKASAKVTYTKTMVDYNYSLGTCNTWLVRKYVGSECVASKKVISSKSSLKELVEIAGL